jgi:ATP-dependent Clp protease adapter protein ClpS
MSTPIKALPKFQIVLNNDEECPYSDVVSALKLIFNLSESEAGILAIDAHTKGKVLLEVVHQEKLELREQQIGAWNERGGHKLPITIKRG